MVDASMKIFYILFILFILFFARSSFAVDVANNFYCSNPVCEEAPNWTAGTANNNANAWCEWNNGGQNGSVVLSFASASHRQYNCMVGAGIRYSFTTSSSDACPAGASGYPCQCVPPATPTDHNQACNVPPVTCDAAGIKNSSFGKGFTMPGASVPDTVCVGGCSFNVTDGVSSATDSYVEIGRSAGSTPCTTTPGITAKPSTPVTPSTPKSCLDEGKSYITMNSVTRCVSPGTAGAAPVSVTQNSTTTTASGTTQTQTVDHQDGDNVSRTVTQTAPGGAVTTTTTNAPINSFCEQNPDSSMCKEKKGSASGGDSCTSPPSCDGDAIACAQLLQIWTARCESQTTSSVRTLGEDVLNGSDPLANKPDPNNPQVVPVGTLNTTEIFTGASCPAPVPANFSVMGHAVALSFDLTPFCTLGGVIGLLNVLASLFAAGRIIAGGI